jgi:AAA+ ATPase superfamily predicted ATPase
LADYKNLYSAKSRNIMYFWLVKKNYKQPKLIIMGKSNIAGRQDEIAIFDKVVASNEAEFIAVYGRRRVGKTFLIKEYFEGHICFEMIGKYKASLADQLDNFAKSLGNSSGLGIISQRPSSWQEALFQLEQYLESPHVKNRPGKKVVFLDELPWINTARSKFLSSLEHFWNSYGSSQNKIILVVCGSAASWMIQNIVRSRGGLHNRLTRQIRLLPFSLTETEAFFRKRKIKLTRFQIVELYMAFGGVPYYLKQAEPAMSVAQIIDYTCFSKNGVLRDEYDKLYASLFENSHNHLKIVEILSKKNKGITRNELLGQAKLFSGGTATKVLNELQESGFIDSYVPLGKNLKDALFRLTDEFTQFYFDWIKPLGKTSPGAGHWLTRQNQPVKNTWAGFTFENICIKHVQKIKDALGISKVETKESAWRYQPAKDSEMPGAQIDLIIDRRDATINLCEVKFANSEFVIDANYANILRRKVDVFRSVTKTKKNVYITMITTYGVAKNAYFMELGANSITIDSLF